MATRKTEGEGFTPFGKKPFQQWRVSRSGGKSMNFNQLAYVLNELGWQVEARAGGTSHHSVTHPLLPWLNVTLAHRRWYGPGEVMALSAQTGFTRADLERNLRVETRTLMFLERAMAAFPAKAEAIKKHYDPLRRKYLADKLIAREYEQARLSPEEKLRQIMGEPPKKPAKEVSLKDIIETTVPEEGVCGNCGNLGHVYETCPLPYIFIVGWE
jgi:hypothetical protein